MEYNTVEHLEFQFISDTNQIIELGNLSGLALAVGLKQNKPSYDLLALSRDYTIEDNVLKFNLNCYTTNWLREVNKNNTEAYIEISQESLNEKRVMLRDYCYVWPRTLIDGLSPEEIQSNNYFTKEETAEYVDEAVSQIELSGYVTDEELEEGLETKQNVIDADNKLDYDLLSGTPTIPTKTSDLTNDSDFITSDALSGYATESYVNNAVSGKQDEITSENKLDYDLISGAPTIPSDYLSGISANGVALTVTDKTVNIPKASTNDWGLVKVKASAGIMVDSENDFIHTVQAVDAEISSRQNTHYVITPNNLNNAVKAALTDANHLTLTDAEKTTAQSVLGVGSTSGYATESYVNAAVSGKQDEIGPDCDIRAEYVRMDINNYSGDPDFDVETAVNMTRDDVYAVSGQLSGKQDAITNDNKLDYGLISGTPTIPLSTSQLTNDSDFATSGYVDGAVSGKLDKTDYVAPYKLPYSANAVNDGWFEEDIGQTMQWSEQTIIPQNKKIVIVPFTKGSSDDHLVFPTLVAHANEDVIKTVEVWVKMAGDTTSQQGIAAIVVPSNYAIIDEDNFPTSLKGEATNSEAYTYHVFVIRAVPRQSGTLCEVAYSHALNSNINI